MGKTGRAADSVVVAVVEVVVLPPCIRRFWGWNFHEPIPAYTFVKLEVGMRTPVPPLQPGCLQWLSEPRRLWTSVS